jgi:type IV pilus assembly protein PilE
MRKEEGFTLIEVMIVVGIVAILAAIALPSYTQYIQRARVTKAVSGLSDMRLRMERYFQDNRSWAPAAPTVAPCSPNSVAPLPTTTDFTFTCSNLGATTYTVTATGSGTLAGFTYTVDQANTKTSVTPHWGSSNACWILRSGDTGDSC